MLEEILNKKAGDFIDLCNLYNDFSNVDLEQVDKEDELNYSKKIETFCLILKGRFFKNENEATEWFKEFVEVLKEIRERYWWLFNPAPIPTNLENNVDTYGSELRANFAEDYGGYTEIVYLLCISFNKMPKEILNEMNASEFLFWGEYVYRKKIIENIK